jgi:membrane protease YdiL (CAAX protease family)
MQPEAEPDVPAFPRRFTLVAVAGEGALALIGLDWIQRRDLPWSLGSPVASIVVGASGATILVVVQLALLRRASSVPGVRAMRRVYADFFRPLFAGIGVGDVVAISFAAGVGEEVLFRGAVQPELGLVPASLLFGAVHLGRQRNLVFGAWAAALGLLLGLMAIWTRGLLAPIVTHAVYDALAIAYIRWGPPFPDHELTTRKS